MVGEGIKSMDLNLLRMAVFEKTGIKVDTEDPIFALVALHETVLAESVAHQLNAIDEATARMHAQTAELLAAGTYLNALLSASGHTVDGVPPPSASAAVSAPATPSMPPADLRGPSWLPRLVAAGLAVALASACLTLLGQALFHLR